MRETGILRTMDGFLSPATSDTSTRAYARVNRRMHQVCIIPIISYDIVPGTCTRRRTTYEYTSRVIRVRFEKPRNRETEDQSAYSTKISSLALALQSTRYLVCYKRYLAVYLVYMHEESLRADQLSACRSTKLRNTNTAATTAVLCREELPTADFPTTQTQGEQGDNSQLLGATNRLYLQQYILRCVDFLLFQQRVLSSSTRMKSESKRK